MFFPNISNRLTHSWSNLINYNTINIEFSNKSNLVYKLISNKSINLEIFLRDKHKKKPRNWCILWRVYCQSKIVLFYNTLKLLEKVDSKQFPFFLVQQAHREHLKTILPYRPMAETWRHMATPHRSEPRSNP